MQRALLYVAAFVSMAVVFAGTLIVTGLLFGTPTRTGEEPSEVPAASGPVAGGAVGEITITAFDLGFEPAMVHLEEAGTYTVTFVNDGGVLHDVTFADGTKISAEGHATATGEVTIPAEGMSFICSVPGHSDAGMTGEVMVSGTAEASHGAEPSERTAEEMRDIDAAVTAQFPAETEGRGNVVLEPEVQADGVLQWELTASVIEWETEPGTVVEAYAYNGMVPGPQLRAEVGDRIRIILHNDLPVPTTIHSHGLFVPPEMDGVPVISQPAVMPGETFTYEYTLRQRRLAHVPQSLHGRGAGADGAAGRLHRDGSGRHRRAGGRRRLRDDPQRRPARLHHQRQGLPGHRAARASAGADDPHPLHERGAADPPDAPARDPAARRSPRTGGRCRLRTSRTPSSSRRASGSTLLVEATEVGVWAFHCHILTHAEGPDGMFGMVTAMIVEE